MGTDSGKKRKADESTSTGPALPQEGKAHVVQVDASDVVKIILQFCKENNLKRSFEVIRDECQTSLNTVDSIDTFLSDINTGKWDAVLSQVAHLQIPQMKYVDLYEQIILEMSDLKEFVLATQLLKSSVMMLLRKEDETRYLSIENAIQEARQGRPQPRSNKDKRAKLARSLSQEVSVIPPSRLMTIVGQALKWQRMQGVLPAGAEIDLLRGVAVGKMEEEERCPTTLSNTIRFGKDCHIECAKFSPDGLVLATGSVDGFVEIWDTSTFKLKTDLSYQASDQFMLHSCAVLCVDFGRDGELICSGDQDGKIKVWRYRSGKCIRELKNAHSMGVTTVAFSRDGGQVLSGSFDAVIRIHGLKSGRILKEFRGHTSYVNHAIYFNHGQQILSGSSDGTVHIWELKTTECVKKIRPPQRHAGDEASVLSIHLYPKNNDYFIVCNRSSTVYLMTQEGQVVKSFHLEKEQNFIQACVSTQGEYVYGLGADRKLYCFQTDDTRLEEVFEVSEVESIGLVHHPFKNLVATYGTDGMLKAWVP